MKKLWILCCVFVVSVSFGRVSERHAKIESPYDLAVSNKKAHVIESNKSSDDGSIKWKRRHKKRKKSRRPQRGR